ncbi:protein phosphatase 2C domain-containing protein [Streptomyces sp. NRRL S-340]|uniref:protein phosphatase 2C domain-containing protein n=1 Tax=Streptomyces sp. NRRL S-340 TaxID=1463901 RepID=UPI00055D48E6|nr:protein phosphatase 2C domain-containing protein [Streptomyces sp. NRRL S-340]
MSQQGGRPTGHEDDWWRQLYDDSTEDTGPTAAADSLDDRFASAAGTVGRAPRTGHPGPGRPGDRPEERPDAPVGKDESPVREDYGVAPAHEDYGEAPGYEDYGEAPVSEGDGEAPGYDGWDGPPVDDGEEEWIRFGRPTPSPAPPPPPPPSPPSPPPPVAGASPPVPAPPPSPRPEREPAPAPRPVAESARPPAPRPPEAAEAPRDTPPPSWQRAPWEPPPSVPPGPKTFPPGPDGPPGPASPPGPPGGSRPSGPETSPASGDGPADHCPPPLAVTHVGSGPPTYEAEPTALPLADPEALDDLVPDTVLDGAGYGACTLRAVSVRGDSPRYRGEPRRDALLTARFGAGEQALVLVAMATGARARPGAHRAAAEACQWIARAVGRSHVRLAEDIRAARRGELKSGLHRLTDRSLGRLRASAAELGVAPEEYTATLRCLLLPADPACRTRVFFGAGGGGLFRLRDGTWQDIEPRGAGPRGTEPRNGAPGAAGRPPRQPGPSRPPASAGAPRGERLTMDPGLPVRPVPRDPAPGTDAGPEPPHEPFRFRACVARPGDTLLMCTAGLAEPLRGEEELCAHLARRWSGPLPPGLAAFLADAQVRVKGYADDRTAAAVWEA